MHLICGVLSGWCLGKGISEGDKFEIAMGVAGILAMLVVIWKTM